MKCSFCPWISAWLRGFVEFDLYLLKNVLIFEKSGLLGCSKPEFDEMLTLMSID